MSFSTNAGTILRLEMATMNTAELKRAAIKGTWIFRLDSCWSEICLRPFSIRRIHVRFWIFPNTLCYLVVFPFFWFHTLVPRRGDARCSCWSHHAQLNQLSVVSGATESTNSCFTEEIRCEVGPKTCQDLRHLRRFASCSHQTREAVCVCGSAWSIFNHCNCTSSHEDRIKFSEDVLAACCASWCR